MAIANIPSNISSHMQMNRFISLFIFTMLEGAHLWSGDQEKPTLTDAVSCTLCTTAAYPLVHPLYK